MSESKLKICLCGGGRMGQIRGQAIASNRRAELVRKIEILSNFLYCFLENNSLFNFYLFICRIIDSNPLPKIGIAKMNLSYFYI